MKRICALTDDRQHPSVPGRGCKKLRGKVRSGAISRILCSTSLHPHRGSHSSRLDIAAQLVPPTRRLARAALCQRCRWRVCLFGVAPDGGCRVSRPRRLPGVYSSLWPCSSRHRARPLAVIPPYGVRTFLDAPEAHRDCPPHFAGGIMTEKSRRSSCSPQNALPLMQRKASCIQKIG